MSRPIIGTLERAVRKLGLRPEGRGEVFRKRLSEAQAIDKHNREVALLFFQIALSALPDPRRRQGTRYPLKTIVVTALMAMICGADDAQAMEYWGKSHEEWLCTILDMPHGAPTQDVYLEVFAILDSEAFSDVFRSWAQMISIELKGKKRDINVDGKVSRRSYDTAKNVSAIHTVNAWCREAGICLGQIQTDAKSNEITAVPELLKKLDIKNATITTDAMNCQTETARVIIERGGDYLLAVKENQPSLHHDIVTAFQYADTCKTLAEQGLPPPLTPPSIDRHSDVNKGHGRLEERRVEVCRDLSWLEDHVPKWSQLKYFVRVTRKRTQILNQKTSVEVAYYIGSDPEIKVVAIAESIRGHWSVETSLHWVLDVAFKEDDARHRAGNAARNMAILRQFALNLIKRDKTRKLGVANTRKLAGWNPEILVKLLVDSDFEI